MYPDETPYYKEVEELPMPIQKEMALLRRAALQRFGDLGVIFPEHTITFATVKVF